MRFIITLAASSFILLHSAAPTSAAPCDGDYMEFETTGTSDIMTESSFFWPNRAGGQLNQALYQGFQDYRVARANWRNAFDFVSHIDPNTYWVTDGAGQLPSTKLLDSKLRQIKKLISQGGYTAVNLFVCCSNTPSFGNKISLAKYIATKLRVPVYAPRGLLHFSNGYPRVGDTLATALPPGEGWELVSP